MRRKLSEEQRLAASKLPHQVRWTARPLARLEELIPPGVRESGIATFQICLVCAQLFEVGEDEPIKRCLCLPRSDDKCWVR